MSDASQLWLARGNEVLAMCLIGDGVLTAIDPRRHLHLWQRGPEAWEQVVEPFAERPALTRLLGVAEVALGVWLGRRQRTH